MNETQRICWKYMLIKESYERDIMGKFGILGELTWSGPRPLGEESCCLPAVFYTLHQGDCETYIVHSIQYSSSMLVLTPGHIKIKDPAFTWPILVLGRIIDEPRRETRKLHP